MTGQCSLVRWCWQLDHHYAHMSRREQSRENQTRWLMFDIICSCLYHSDLWIMKEACQRQLLDASIIRPSTWNINNGFHAILDVVCLSLSLSPCRSISLTVVHWKRRIPRRTVDFPESFYWQRRILPWGRLSFRSRRNCSYLHRWSTEEQ